MAVAMAVETRSARSSSRERRVTRATDAATRVAMGLNLGAGVLAVAVGTLWLALSGLGLLGSL